MRYNGHANDVNKTFTTLATLQGNLVDDCDVMNPSIRISIAGENYIRTCNYAYIPAFARYYFLTKPPTVLTTGMWQYDFHVDVLMSYRDRLMRQSGIVSLQEKIGTQYIDGEQFKAFQNTMIYTEPFPNGFSGRSFILTVAGGVTT